MSMDRLSEDGVLYSALMFGTQQMYYRDNIKFREMW